MFLTECFESVSGKEETGIGCLLNQLFVLTDTNILKFLMSDNITTNNFKNIILRYILHRMDLVIIYWQCISGIDLLKAVQNLRDDM